MPSPPAPTPSADEPEQLFAALADATRRRVLVMLAAEGAATATGLAAAFPVTRQAIAKHLQVLLEAGVVAAERRGRETHWAFVPGSLEPAAAWLSDLDGTRRDTLGAWQRHLDDERRRRGLAPAVPGLRAAASARRPRPRPPG